MAENIAVPYEIYARRQLAAEMEELAKAPLDRVDAGGRYIGTDGQLHDAHGQVIEGGESAGAFDAETATKEELVAEAERRGITVARADGKEGEPLVSDYRAALA